MALSGNATSISFFGAFIFKFVFSTGSFGDREVCKIEGDTYTSNTGDLPFFIASMNISNGHDGRFLRLTE